jgi:hypothetical protein
VEILQQFRELTLTLRAYQTDNKVNTPHTV